MKQPKKLTRSQKELITKRCKKKIDVKDWMLIMENEESLHIIHKETKEIKVINK